MSMQKVDYPPLTTTKSIIHNLYDNATRLTTCQHYRSRSHCQNFCMRYRAEGLYFTLLPATTILLEMLHY